MEKVVSVYGYGRFGKLWADILAEDFQVKVYSRRGLQAEEVRAGIKISDAEDIYDCDALFFCVAISSFEEVLRASRPYYREETIFFDTCSVKVLPVGWMKEQLPARSQIIATHPMFGPDSYRRGGKNPAMVMSHIRSDATVFADWQQYFTAKSLQVEVLTPEEHDRMVAYSQGITHYMGRVFADLQLQPSSIDTLGYRSLLEVMAQTCNDSWQLFLDLQNYNPYTEEMRLEMRQAMVRVNDALNAG